MKLQTGHKQNKKNYRDPNKSNKLQRARILKTNPPIKMQN